MLSCSSPTTATSLASLLPIVEKSAPSLLDPLALITPDRALRTLSRKQIGGLISQGHLLIMHRGLVYRMNRWLRQHPGGVLVILHFVGRDATDEIEANHPLAAIQQMRHFVCARVDMADWKADSDPTSTGWTPFVPPFHLGWTADTAEYEKVPSINATLAALELLERDGYPTDRPAPTMTLPALSRQALEPPAPPTDVEPLRQHQLSLSFRKLRHELLAEDDLFVNDPLRLYAATIARISAFTLSFIASWYYSTQRWHLAVSAVSLGLAMHSAMFVAHDCGHNNLTGKRSIDYAIGGFLASFCSGLSLGWWNSQHDVHHSLCNDPVHDPDIQLLAFFAFTSRSFKSLYSTFHACVIPYDAFAAWLVPYQHLYFYPVMVFARFSLVGKSYYYLAFKAKADHFRAFEVVGIVAYWCWFIPLLKSMGSGLDGLINAVGFVLIWLCTLSAIHVQIVLSHSAVSDEDKGMYESFVVRQLRTTQDVACPESISWVHGGLENQITHHLLPRLPRPNLRRATQRVKAWAAENGVEFQEKSFSEGNTEMTGMLAAVASQARAYNAKVRELARGECHLEI